VSVLAVRGGAEDGELLVVFVLLHLNGSKNTGQLGVIVQPILISSWIERTVEVDTDAPQRSTSSPANGLHKSRTHF
jgi:hypothetical protein